MSGPAIRLGTVDDARQIADYNIAMARETEDLVLDDTTCYEGCKAILADPSKGFYIVAVEEGQIVGQLMITYEWSDWRCSNAWWIQSVFVVPSKRRQGIFTSLYNHVREMCEKQGGAGLRLYVDDSNFTAQGVYRKLGMVRRLVHCANTPLALYAAVSSCGSGISRRSRCPHACRRHTTVCSSRCSSRSCTHRV